jgi:hypothetical protein
MKKQYTKRYLHWKKKISSEIRCHISTSWKKLKLNIILKKIQMCFCKLNCNNGGHFLWERIILLSSKYCQSSKDSLALKPSSTKGIFS